MLLLVQVHVQLDSKAVAAHLLSASCQQSQLDILVPLQCGSSAVTSWRCGCPVPAMRGLLQVSLQLYHVDKPALHCIKQDLCADSLYALMRALHDEQLLSMAALNAQHAAAHAHTLTSA